MGRVIEGFRLSVALALLSGGCTGKSASAPAAASGKTKPSGPAQADAKQAVAPVEAETPTANPQTTAAAEPRPALSAADPETVQAQGGNLLETADLVFARCASKHARALEALMGGEVNHVGIAFVTAKGPQVLAAEEFVAQVPYDQWLRRCRPSRVVIKRLQDGQTLLAPDRLLPLQRFSFSVHQRKYDFAFDWSDDDLYASEYVRKAFAKGPGVELGPMQTLSALGATDDAIATHNAAHGTSLSAQTEVISPSSIFDDDHLTTVFDSASESG